MKKQNKDLHQKNTAELKKEIEKARQDLAKLQLERKLNPPKDTNVFSKQKRKLAVLLTLLNEMETQERLNESQTKK